LSKSLFGYFFVFAIKKVFQEFSSSRGISKGLYFSNQKTQAYILNKASELGADITVELELGRDSPYLPKKVTIFGTSTPYAKQQMVEFMESELGIAKEDQRWIS
jgi:hypothetical protein